MVHGENTEWHIVRRTSAPGQTDANSHGTMRLRVSTSFVLADRPSPFELRSVRFPSRGSRKGDPRTRPNHASGTDLDCDIEDYI